MEQITRVDTELASLDLVTEFAEMNCCSGLNMFDLKKSKGKVFSWRGRNWICTGSLWQNGHYLEADIRVVVNPDHYDGPANNNELRGPDFYLGGFLSCKGKVWIMTSYKLELVAEEFAKWKQEKLF